MATLPFDVVIVGASFGGVAAALAAAADPNVRVALLEAGEWVGGQATSQGVTRWDEAPAALTEKTGSTKSYRDLRNAIRKSYADAGVISPVGKQQEFLNPGFARVGPPFAPKGHPFAADPSRVQTILRAQLDALRPRLTLRTGAVVTAADVVDGEIRGLTVTGGGATDTYVAKFYLDATDLGELLPLCHADWRIGAESQEETQEPNAPHDAHRDFIQAITVPIAMELAPDGNGPKVAKPANYDAIRAAQGFDHRDTDDQGRKVFDGDIGFVFKPLNPPDGDTLWNYRRYIDAENFVGLRDRTTINMKFNDYQKRTVPTGSAQTDAAVFEEARAVSVAYAYYLQHDCPRDDRSGNGYPNMVVVDAFGTGDGTARAAYIRESRRLSNPRTLIAEQDILDTRPYAERVNNPQRAPLFPDACGIGWYAMDIHGVSGISPNFGQQAYAAKAFQIPVGALLSKTPPANLIAACKNIGATHLTSGAYRVHPVEWAIGEAAGVLAAFCVTQRVAAADVWAAEGRLVAYQRRLLARGVPIFWWSDVYFEDGAAAFTAIQLLGARGLLAGEGDFTFHPGEPIDQGFRDALDERVGRPLPWPKGSMTRAAAAEFIVSQLGPPL